MVRFVTWACGGGLALALALQLGGSAWFLKLALACWSFHEGVPLQQVEIFRQAQPAPLCVSPIGSSEKGCKCW